MLLQNLQSPGCNSRGQLAVAVPIKHIQQIGLVASDRQTTLPMIIVILSLVVKCCNGGTPGGHPSRLNEQPAAVQ